MAMPWILLFILVCVLISQLPSCMTSEPFAKGPVLANLTVFDDAETSTGIKPSAYPIKYKGVNVYPIAVHHDEYARDRCKILRVTKENGTFWFYGHVVDLCNRKDADCVNKRANGRNYLVDLHGKFAARLKVPRSITKIRVVDEGKRLSTALLPKRFRAAWLTDNHIRRTNGYTCDFCC